MHGLWAMGTRIPELGISDGEGKEFAKRFEAVARHYNIETTQKAVDWAMLMIFMGGVEGPRVALWMSKRQQKAVKPAPNYGVERTEDGAAVLRPQAWHGPVGEGVIDGEFDVN